jgi:hypothetical protein
MQTASLNADAGYVGLAKQILKFSNKLESIPSQRCTA